MTATGYTSPVPGIDYEAPPGPGASDADILAWQQRAAFLPTSRFFNDRYGGATTNLPVSAQQPAGNPLAQPNPQQQPNPLAQLIQDYNQQVQQFNQRGQQPQSPLLNQLAPPQPQAPQFGAPQSSPRFGALPPGLQRMGQLPQGIQNQGGFPGARPPASPSQSPLSTQLQQPNANRRFPTNSFGGFGRPV